MSNGNGSGAPALSTSRINAMIKEIEGQRDAMAMRAAQYAGAVVERDERIAGLLADLAARDAEIGRLTAPPESTETEPPAPRKSRSLPPRADAPVPTQ